MFAFNWPVEPTTAIVDWLTPLFSLATGCDHGVNMGCLPLFVVELNGYELRLEKFEPALRC